MRSIAITPVRLWLVIGFLVTGGAAGAWAVMQQTQRLGADDPQVQIAEDGAIALEQGRAPEQVAGGDTVDIARSIAPFVVVIDDAGSAVASSGRLDGRIVAPPPGVLASVRAGGETRITWAPRPSVRLASVVRRVQGAHPGFIVAARSLREPESRIAQMGHMIAVGWLLAMLAAAAGVALLASMTQPRA